MKTKKMRILLLLFIGLYIISRPVIANWHGTINSLQILPSNPNVNDEVMLVCNSTFPQASCILTSHSIIIEGDQIVVDLHYFLGDFFMICPSIDFITLGYLDGGNYMLTANIYTQLYSGVADSKTISFSVDSTVILPGDSNCDGSVNTLDVVTTINYIQGNNPQPFCFENADVNGDGSVNAMDVVETISIILGSGFICGTSTITDIDGNIYNTVQIGNQCWMKENLKTTGDAAGNYITRYCYDNNTAWCELYGGLYTWYTIMNGEASSNSIPSGVQGICPVGWHVPGHYEWVQLTLHLDGEVVAGGKLKSIRTEPIQHPRWHIPNTGATNESEFSALPGGTYGSGWFTNLGSHGYWWSATENSPTHAWFRSLMYDNPHVSRFVSHKSQMYSLRCLRD